MAAPLAKAWVPRLQRWVEGEPNIRLALLVGSQARSAAPADRFSDIDLALFARDPAALLDDPAWVGRLGPYWTSHVEGTPVGSVRERRVLFCDGQDIDFAVFPHDALAKLMGEASAAAVLHRGFRVLVDKDATLGPIPRWEPPPALPSEAEFSNVVNDFWFHLVWAAKKSRRGEWTAASEAVNGTLRSALIRVARWHALARGPAVQDTWHGARYFEKWADPRVLRDLPETVAGVDAASITKALRANRALFTWLSDEVRERLSFANPIRDLPGLSRYLSDLLAADAP